MHDSLHIALSDDPVEASSSWSQNIRYIATEKKYKSDPSHEKL